LPYLDTGALYRAATWFFAKNGVNLRNVAAFERQIQKCDLIFTEGDKGTRIWVEGSEITDELRSPDLTKKVGQVCVIPEVREWLVRLQRNWALRGFGIMEGRDIGTVVLPDAELKIYITAHPELRAKRRAKDFGIADDTEAVARLTEEIAQRDKQDAERSEAPMKPADDAVILDTSDMSFEDQVRRVIVLAKERFGIKVYN
ncbi:MAG: (d)CMP kinase, partial [Calditrichaeota bacterium]|nr:(d)CMP kinase [Calditrichota bacterium]